jgi:hypothetical protein
MIAPRPRAPLPRPAPASGYRDPIAEREARRAGVAVPTEQQLPVHPVAERIARRAGVVLPRRPARDEAAQEGTREDRGQRPARPPPGRKPPGRR